jgi:hypothetical protein
VVAKNAAEYLTPTQKKLQAGSGKKGSRFILPAQRDWNLKRPEIFMLEKSSAAAGVK